MVSLKTSARMVDVTSKEMTRRIAKAQATLKFSAKAYNALKSGKCPKGNVLETAKVAGIMAAKSTPMIIPMCHSLEIGKINVEISLIDKSREVCIQTEVVYKGQTGVEMEALTAASVASLTVYDMMKWADKGIVIKEIKLLSKSGGKSGDYRASNN